MRKDTVRKPWLHTMAALVTRAVMTVWLVIALTGGTVDAVCYKHRWPPELIWGLPLATGLVCALFIWFVVWTLKKRGAFSDDGCDVPTGNKIVPLGGHLFPAKPDEKPTEKRAEKPPEKVHVDQAQAQVVPSSPAAKEKRFSKASIDPQTALARPPSYPPRRPSGTVTVGQVTVVQTTRIVMSRGSTTDNADSVV